MSDNWQIGDLALCVNDVFTSPLRAGVTRPCAGAIYQVDDVRPEYFNGAAAIGLVLHDGPLNRKECNGIVSFEPIWASYRFRKIRPLTDEERDSFTAELRNDQRTPVEV